MQLLKIPDATSLIHQNYYNTDKHDFEKNREVDKNIQYTSGLVTTILLNTKISEDKNKILDNFKYITFQEL